MNSLIVVLTRKCNPCACSYCNVFKSEDYNFWEGVYKDKAYFKKIIKDIIFFLKKNNIKSIRFFGGEVFLEKKILIDFVKLLRENDFDGDIWVNTNLHLFEKKDLGWIKENNIKIITSLNGDKKIHTKTRGVKINDYNLLLENVKYLLRNKIYVQVNVVLFPYEKDFIQKIKSILKLNPSNVNILPLMYSKLIINNKNTFLNKLENLLFWIKENKLNNKFLNFSITDIKSSFPLVSDEFVLDSNGDIYISMLVLENFAKSFKEILYIGDMSNIKKLEIDKNSIKILLETMFNLLKKLDIFVVSVDLSSAFTDLVYKYK